MYYVQFFCLCVWFEVHSFAWVRRTVHCTEYRVFVYYTVFLVFIILMNSHQNHRDPTPFSFNRNSTVTKETYSRDMPFLLFVKYSEYVVYEIFVQQQSTGESFMPRITHLVCYIECLDELVNYPQPTPPIEWTIGHCRFLGQKINPLSIFVLHCFTR